MTTSVNYVEDAMISQIDFNRSGIDPMAQEEALFFDRRCRSFFMRMFEMSLEAADTFPGDSDLDLSVRVGSVGLLIAHEKEKINVLCFRTGLSRRRLKDLEPGHPARVDLEWREQRIRDLQEAHTQLVKCVNSRKFLKQQPGLIKFYYFFKFNRKLPNVEPVIANLRLLYPDF